MKNTKWTRIITAAVLLSFALACSISFTGSDEESGRDTEIQQTLQAIQQTQTAAAAAAGDEEEPESSAETTTETEAVEATPTITIDPTPCNRSHMTDETIPDETQFDSGDNFIKSWTLRNDGRCDWTTDYKFVFVEGSRMGGASSQNLTKVVEPGEFITLSVELTAPDDDGEYTGIWKLKADDGETFGNYWVNIYVGEPEPMFAVTSVSYYMPHTTIDTGCPNDINVKAEITSNTAGKVTYKWKDSAGGSSSTKSVTFDEAEKKIVDYNVTVSATGDYWAQLYIDNPNHQWFDQKEFHVNCTP